MEISEIRAFMPFADLADPQVEPLLPHVEPWEAPPGTILASQDQAPTHLWLVTEGELESWWRDYQDGLEYGGPRVGPGETVGAAEGVLGREMPFTVAAGTEVRGFRLPAPALVERCREDPTFHLAVLQAVLKRLHTRPYLGGSRFVDLARLKVDESLWSLLPLHLIAKYRALPLARNGRVLVVGFVDPANLNVLDDVSRALAAWRVRSVAMSAAEFEPFFRTRVQPALDRRGHDDATRDRWFAALRNKNPEVRLVEPTPATSAEERSRQVSGDVVVALLNRLIGEALELGASDIHLEPTEREMVVRYRVDGQLRRRPEVLEARYHGAVVSRAKALGRMDIAERRRAQDGRLTVEHDGRILDFRLSTVPTRFGEKLVLRILDPSSVLVDLERLVPFEPAYRAIRSLVDQPQGLLVVSGPTGSGKTTTIYSTLLRLRVDAVNIVTVEDPIEYTVDGVTQVQVHDAAGVTFASSVPHFLRQDPDVIVVGETRDPETARTAVEAAMTGHLVITSLHTNNAAGAVARLRDMGIEAFLLAHTLIGVVSQRLVRRVCPTCCRPVEYPPELVAPLGIFNQAEIGSGMSFLKGAGCLYCNFQGYRGRMATFEVLRVDDRLRPLIAAEATIQDLDAEGRAGGQLLPLSDCCRYLLGNGLTTPEEIARILFVDH